MNIVLDPFSFNQENLFFMEKKKNNIINGCFSKIIYSSELFTMNGIIFVLPFKLQDIYTPTMNPLYKESTCNIYFYTHDKKNMRYISILSDIEKIIINTYKEINGITKRSILSLSAKLHKGYFKIFREKQITKSSSSKQYMLKISGIWENQEEIGITYKFIELHNEQLL